MGSPIEDPEPEPVSGELPCPNASANGTIPDAVLEELQKDCGNHLNESLGDVERDLEQQPDLAGTLIAICTEGTEEHKLCFGNLIKYVGRCKDSLDEANMTDFKEALDRTCDFVKMFAKSLGSSSVPNMTGKMGMST